MSPQRYNATSAIAALRIIAAAAVAALGASPAASDDVWLHNGNTFEGVIVVSESDDQIRIRLAYGEMSLPASWVARIERSSSPLERYLERRAELRARLDAGVEPWIELARWARARQLEHGHKEALIEASRLDPRHPALAPLLRGIGYVFEQDTGLWISAAERRRAEAVRQARIEAEAERARRAEAAADGGGRRSEETLSRAIEALALAELERETRTSRREARGERTYHPFRVGTYAGPYYPYFPGFVTVPAGGGDSGDAPGSGGASSSAPPPDPYAVVRGRLPGSLVVAQPRSSERMNSQSRPRLPGSLLSARPY